MYQKSIIILGLLFIATVSSGRAIGNVLSVPTEKANMNNIKPQTRVNVSGTWKPNVIAYKIIKELENLDKGAVVEVITKNNEGIAGDIEIWCEATGHVFLGVQKTKEELLSSFIRKGELKKNDHIMTVIISTASLDHVLYPLDKALAGAVSGMEVNVVFEGAGVRLLKNGYRSKLSGLIGGFFTGIIEKKVMKKEIGWPLPQETVKMLDDLGAHIYCCGPSMYGYRVETEELAVNCTIAAHLTWTDLLANSDIQIFSRAVIEKP